jgi:hypothetical protein
MHSTEAGAEERRVSRFQPNTLREMIDALPTLTIAGRRLGMDKVLAHLRSSQEFLKRANGQMAQTLSELGRETNRLVPDVNSFCVRALGLLDRYEARVRRVVHRA